MPELDAASGIEEGWFNEGGTEDEDDEQEEEGEEDRKSIWWIC